MVEALKGLFAPGGRQAFTRDAMFWGGAIVAVFLLHFVFFDGSKSFSSQWVLFSLYLAINLMWMLVLGTAGIYSFGTLFVVGVGAYFAAYVGGASRAGYDLEGARAIPVVLMLLIGLGAGIVAGIFVALPGIRLRGVYFALFTIGLVELGRAIVVQQNTLGQNEGLSGATRFISQSEVGLPAERTTHFWVGLALILFCLVVYRIVDGGRLGLLLRTARESEPVARGVGIDINRARLLVFIISSAVMGLIGGFYAGFFGATSPGIFEFDLLLLLLAMVVVGGLGSAKGAALGTALLLFIDQTWLESGPKRLIAIGVIMLLVTLVARKGVAGVPQDIWDWWQRRKGVPTGAQMHTAAHAHAVSGETPESVLAHEVELAEQLAEGEGTDASAQGAVQTLAAAETAAGGEETAAPVDAVPDDLTVIEGIGPKLSEVLAGEGITTWAALANTSVDELRAIVARAGSRFSLADPTSWPEQAQLAASGDWAGLDELKAKLSGGRH